jgi:predicted membrane-bound spermidine synthase
LAQNENSVRPSAFQRIRLRKHLSLFLEGETQFSSPADANSRHERLLNNAHTVDCADTGGGRKILRPAHCFSIAD